MANIILKSDRDRLDPNLDNVVQDLLMSKKNKDAVEICKRKRIFAI